MAQKPVKKNAAKTAAVKKAPAKKAVAKKAPAKKTPVKKAAMPEMTATMPAPEMHECNCGHACACGADCKCGCRGGSKFGRFMKKLIIALIIFALGFAAAKFFCCDKPHFRGPRVHFVEGCLDVASVKCPQLQAALPAMDINQDGCITKDEYRAVKKEMRREIREMQVEIAD